LTLVEASERKAIVRECIGLSPNNYRSVLILRDIEEPDTEQTASLHNLTLGTVKVRLHRARQALKALLRRYTEFRSR
jgi:RNA polymerase sigma-70 factor, ECF subfamily